ncbi:helix-turn-helix domain-containing protein [Vibrio tasmaniensis 1F-187]|nr:helix-turn-helix transcriptional regulator [Vibrio tasmaniensis]OEF63102.1 transcriptional regulator [Vibrio tasmaniensis 1F-187]
MSTESASFKSNFGLRVKSARKNLGWSQEILAKELKVSRDTLSRYERGELSPSLEVFSRMLEQFSVLEIQAEDLLVEREQLQKQTQTVSSWGWATGFSFLSGGAFTVGATCQDITRLLEVMIDSFPPDHPFETTVDEIKEYLSSQDDADQQAKEQLEFELEVPIAQQAASLKPEFPKEQKGKVDKIFDKYLEEKTKVTSLQQQVAKLQQEMSAKH